jgi:LITAF-like zinc ribbon domain
LFFFSFYILENQFVVFNILSAAGAEPEISVSGVPDAEAPAYAATAAVPAYAAAASAPPADNGPPIVYASAATQSKPMATYAVPTASATQQQHHPTHTTTTTTYVIPAPGAAAAASTGGGAAVGANGKLINLGRDPKRLQCPFCNEHTVTRARHQIDVFTIVMVVMLVFLFWPVCWLPLVLPGCKTTEHFCSHCQRKVRIYICITSICCCCCCLFLLFDLLFSHTHPIRSTLKNKHTHSQYTQVGTTPACDDCCN